MKFHSENIKFPLGKFLLQALVTLKIIRNLLLNLVLDNNLNQNVQFIISTGNYFSNMFMVLTIIEVMNI